jgi:hypothetical protein
MYTSSLLCASTMVDPDPHCCTCTAKSCRRTDAALLSITRCDDGTGDFSGSRRPSRGWFTASNWSVVILHDTISFGARSGRPLDRTVRQSPIKSAGSDGGASWITSLQTAAADEFLMGTVEAVPRTRFDTADSKTNVSLNGSQYCSTPRSRWGRWCVDSLAVKVLVQSSLTWCGIAYLQ